MAEVRAELEPKPGILEVSSEPNGAKVQVDGEELGITPCSKSLSSGEEYSVTVSEEGYYPESQMVMVQPEGKEIISVTLKEIPKGTLEVKSEPSGAKVWVNGKNAGVTPYSGLIVADEEHTVIVSAKGYNFKSQKVTVQPKGENVISVTLEKQKEFPMTIIGKDGAEMILIPAGEFIMGSPEGESWYDEYPQHTVFLNAFYIDKYEVTNAQYKLFMDATGYKAPRNWRDGKFNQPEQPVVGVSWDYAVAYAKWAGKRLPTEAEWEKAARGTDGRIYPWGNEWDISKCNSKGVGDGYEYTSPVGSFPAGASPYGLMDMAGNTRELCADWYDEDYYSRSPLVNPKGPVEPGVFHVLRSGSWDCPEDQMRCARRVGGEPSPMNRDFGFRCVQDVMP